MILVDTNLLVYATMKGMPRHEPARSWLEARLNGIEGVGMPWPSLLGFVRIVSNPRVFERPMPVRTAWSYVDGWRSRHNVFTPEPTERHPEVLGTLLQGVGRANLVPDAHLAALAIEHGLTLCSTDGDFARFDALTWEDPLPAEA